MWKVLSQGIHMCNMKALSLVVRKLWPRLKFFKSRSNFKVKASSQATVFESVFYSLHTERGSRRRTKIPWLATMRSRSQGIHMCNMKALSLLVRKLWPRLKFFFTYTRRRGHQGYDISSPDIRPGLLKRFTIFSVATNNVWIPDLNWNDVANASFLLKYYYKYKYVLLNLSTVCYYWTEFDIILVYTTHRSLTCVWKNIHLMHFTLFSHTFSLYVSLSRSGPSGPLVSLTSFCIFL